jgi:hypothetical protein
MIINKLSKHIEIFLTNVSYEIAAYSYNELSNILEILNENKLKQNMKHANENEIANLKNSIKSAKKAAEKAAVTVKEETVEE